MTGPGEYAAAVAVGFLLLMLRKNLGWAALAAVAFDELIEAAAVAALIYVSRARRIFGGGR